MILYVLIIVLREETGRQETLKGDNYGVIHVVTLNPTLLLLESCRFVDAYVI
jgi:hypothetical protein